MMYSFCNADGYFVGGVFCGDESHLAANTPAGCTAVPGRHDPLCRRVDIETGEVVAYQPPAPADDEWQTWDWDATTERWRPVPTLAALRAAAWERIKQARAAATVAPLVVDGYVYNADPTARANIVGSFASAQDAIANNLPWEREWTLADDTAVTLSAAQMIAVGRALDRQIDAAHQHGRHLRALIYDPATTAADLDLITWS